MTISVKKTGTITAAALVALLTLTGCGGGDADTETAKDAQKAPSQVENETVVEKSPEASDADAELAELLEPASALGDYNDEWVNTFGLPKIPDYEIGVYSDRSEATAEMWGEENMRAITLVGPYDLEVIPKYGAVLEKLGWENRTESYAEMGAIEEGVLAWGKRSPEEGHTSAFYITPTHPSDSISGHIAFDFTRSDITTDN